MQPVDPEIEKKDILNRYRNLLRLLKNKTTASDRKLIRRAFEFAAEAHKDMRRKSGEPYIIHPVEVATIAVSEIGLGTTSVICALLHDVVEDTDYSLEDISRLFGEKIASIIDGLTKISGIFDQGTASPSIQAENFRKMLLTLSQDVRVILIKLADRLHNMRTLESMANEKRLKIASETVYLYAPLAHRLGLFSIKSELEDLALKYTEPEIYRTISKKLVESEEERKRFISRFVYPIRKSLTQAGISCKIIYRTKSVNSIWQKMKKKEIPFEEVYDLFAVRIIINSSLETEKADCWKVYSLITDIYRPKQDRLRDWISIPKANGYESLHTTVMSRMGRWVEIQIRSARMDEIAEKGYAAHWKYKSSSEAESGLDDWLNKIRETLQNPESNALDFLDDFKMNLFSDEIYVFTPTGELKTLPVNSTVLDFAYNIHSQIGNSAIGGKVNYKLVPLNHILKSGDQVEVITSRKQTPKEEWYEFVSTARAKTQIKEALKEQKKQFTEQGKEKIRELFEQARLEYSNANLRKLQQYTQTLSTTDFFYKVAIGAIGLKEVRDFATNKGRPSWLSYLKRPFGFIPRHQEKSLGQQIREQLSEKPDSMLLSHDVDEINYTIASCCNAIPGDDVIGFITQNKGTIIIHRTNCEKAISLMSRFGQNIVKAKWSGSEHIAFLAGIKMNGIDKMGLINEITNVISQQLQINIRSFNITSSEGLMEGVAMLYVYDTRHLDELIEKLKQVPGIQKVTRI